MTDREFQAFPHGDPTNGGDIGMTLRDYFAAKAMQASLTDDHGRLIRSEIHASWAYEIADAMLKAREVRPKEAAP